MRVPGGGLHGRAGRLRRGPGHALPGDTGQKHRASPESGAAMTPVSHSFAKETAQKG